MGVTVGILELVAALRRLQIDYELEVVSATKATPLGPVTVRVCGTEAPLVEFEDARGSTLEIHVP